MSNKRNGTVLRVLLSFLTALILLILGFALSNSTTANATANNNKVDIRGMRVNQERTREDIKEIKKSIGTIKQDIKLLLQKSGL